MKRLLKIGLLLNLGLLVSTLAPEATPAQSTLNLSCDEMAVMGAVNQPGRFDFQQRALLSDVLARAGGPNERAGRIVRVHHFCKCSPCNDSEAKMQAGTEYNLHEIANVYVQPGDLVIVPEMNFVVVMGNVPVQKSLVYREGMTSTQALALAGGPIRSGDSLQIRIRRPLTPGKWSVIFAGKLRMILAGEVENPPLRAMDVLEVSDEEGRFFSDVPLKLITPKGDPPLFPRNSPNCE